jgi:hypothetical protein
LNFFKFWFSPLFCAVTNRYPNATKNKQPKLIPVIHQAAEARFCSRKAEIFLESTASLFETAPKENSDDLQGWKWTCHEFVNNLGSLDLVWERKGKKPQFSQQIRVCLREITV